MPAAAIVPLADMMNHSPDRSTLLYAAEDIPPPPSPAVASEVTFSEVTLDGSDKPTGGAVELKEAGRLITRPNSDPPSLGPPPTRVVVEYFHTAEGYVAAAAAVVVVVVVVWFRFWHAWRTDAHLPAFPCESMFASLCALRACPAGRTAKGIHYTPHTTTNSSGSVTRCSC